MHHQYHKYDDPGHGWLKVSPADLGDLGITIDDISICSYARVNKDQSVSLYLEEDCDMWRFFRAYKHKYGSYPSYVTHTTNGVSRIRSYPTIEQIERIIAENMWGHANDYNWRFADSVRPMLSRGAMA